MLAALWWGSLTTTGFLVVPMLFAHLATPAIAGRMAAELFAAQTWVALGCGLTLLIHVRARAEDDRLDGAALTAIFLVVTAMLLALLQQYAVAPRIVARENLQLWHSAGSVMYVAQWLCAGALLWRLSRRA
ncbi:MAG: DUF4149 domain-containing protein [Variovorax sp.]|nr:MAG: DUF4149 domain-containing protein [Variovorax sp.]